MIVDAEKGLAVISRSVIPFDLGVLSLTFAESIIIPGKVGIGWLCYTKLQVEYLHPTLGIAFISWDPKLLGETQVRSVKLSTDFIRQGRFSGLLE
jgi:pro-apoptotic serine protease NMA111